MRTDQYESTERSRSLRRVPGDRVGVEVRGGRIVLRFVRFFTQQDLDVVRSIRGRRWERDEKVWVLPRSAEVLDTLARAFGSRLILPESLLSDGPPDTPQRRSNSTSTARTISDGARLPTSSTGGAAEVSSSRALDHRRETRTSSVEGSANAVLDRLRAAIRARGYSRKTERAYVAWARRFLRQEADRGSGAAELNADQVRSFLEHLAAQRLAARSRNQAASALSFLFREVLGSDELADIPRAKGPTRAPLVLSHREVLQLLRQLTGKYFLVAVLLYSAGLRLEECLRLRVKDVDFELRQIFVRDGKGSKDRYVPLADRAADLVRAQIARVAVQHERDLASGAGWAPLPGALHKKDPRAGYDIAWQFVFPASTTNVDPATGRSGRWPLHASAVQRAVKAAVRRAGIAKRASCHTLRHSFATEALRGGCDIRTLQHVMGHKDIRTTMIYLHVVEQNGHRIRSPLDRPDDADAYEPDPIGSPGAAVSVRWELATRQWNEGKRGVRNASPGASTGTLAQKTADPNILETSRTSQTPPSRREQTGRGYGWKR